MVAPTDFNLESLHGRTFKGFVQFQEPDGSVWFRLKERQEMTFQMNYARAPHYTDDGRKVLDPAGSNHQFQMTLKVTSDMFDDTVWTFTNGILDTGLVIDKETLSYWMYKNELREPIEVIFVTSMEMLSGPSGDTGDDTVNIKFRLDPSGFTTGLGSSGGAPNITVSGEVLAVTNAVRASTSEQ